MLTRIILLFTMIFAASLSYAKDFKMAIHFSPKLQMHGHRHNDMVTLHHDGRRIICRCRPSNVQERNWLADTPKDTCSAMYLEVAYVDGVGTVLMLAREECPDGEEMCIRGIAYLIRANGEWEQGVFSKRTLGWGESESRIWGGYSFTRPKWDKPISIDTLNCYEVRDEKKNESKSN